MAEIVDMSAPASMVAASKPEVKVAALEVAPEIQPSSIEVDIASRNKKKPSQPVKPAPPSPAKSPLENMPKIIPVHSVPTGNVLDDIRTHLQCQSMFANNVEALLAEYYIMKTDLDVARIKLRDNERKLWTAESDRDKYKRNWDQAEAELKEVKDELKETQNKLNDATRRLAETTEKLQDARSQLKEVRRELSDARRRIEGLEKDLKYRIDRIKELEIELARANKGENDANERNTELTKLLWQIEAKKAVIERQKDTELENVRRLQDRVEDREKEISDLKEQLKRRK